MSQTDLPIIDRINRGYYDTQGLAQLKYDLLDALGFNYDDKFSRIAHQLSGMAVGTRALRPYYKAIAERVNAMDVAVIVSAPGKEVEKDIIQAFTTVGYYVHYFSVRAARLTDIRRYGLPPMPVPHGNLSRAPVTGKPVINLCNVILRSCTLAAPVAAAAAAGHIVYDARIRPARNQETFDAYKADPIKIVDGKEPKYAAGPHDGIWR